MGSGEWERPGERVESLVRVLEEGSSYEALVSAARRLLRLRATEALVPLVRWLTRAEPGTELYELLIAGLKDWGPAVAPATLEVLEDIGEGEARFELLQVLSHCGARDERIYTALLALLEEEPFQGSVNLSAYGDARAVELLSRALDAYELEDDVADVFAQQTVLELGFAIQELGGALTRSQQMKLEAARRLREEWNELIDRWRASTHERQSSRPGRNEPCWCGSGVKYKKCHLGADRARLP
ncbi:SEC-C motif domain protein [Cystobacter fuscus DSM 2262]|uniref:SEC-C motif domain protein n=1 Tax=Cystobacter fuscus (strain ATCC 25194 / DSM 2262 / NBRC 100088 / M29) TaxID=1242864 RepID=S9PC30_CYSF2|nr:SEC-C domain-containing protein [Cystobacter fuscus]EPX59847.1 SEC-C motif domain protein [Cystobacter fuscus DSM 2262]